MVLEITCSFGAPQDVIMQNWDCLLVCNAYKCFYTTTTTKLVCCKVVEVCLI